MHLCLINEDVDISDAVSIKSDTVPDNMHMWMSDNLWLQTSILEEDC